MDNNMDRKSGLEVIEEMRKKGYKDPICMNSAIMGRTDSSTIEAIKESFNIDFIRKGLATIKDYGDILEKYGI